MSLSLTADVDTLEHAHILAHKMPTRNLNKYKELGQSLQSKPETFN